MVEYKVGSVVFFNWNNPFMRLVRLYNLFKYGELGFAHVGIITEVTKDQVLIHEAISDGFVSSWYNRSFLDEKYEEGAMDIKYPNTKLINVKEIADNYLERKYGFFDLFCILLVLLFPKSDWYLKFTSANRLICSEAVSIILLLSSNYKLDLSKEYNKQFDLITPHDIYKSDQFIS